MPDPTPLPEGQRTIAPRFFHPTGRFSEFPLEDLERSIPELFARQARRHPERVAVKTPTRALTYAELDRWSARIARAILRRRGPASEPVAVILERDTPLIVAMLGVLQAGKILVVLEPGHPAARNAAVLQEALEEAFVAPRTPVEERLARIWAEALALDAVGMRDPFLDLGGTSLDATRIASRVQTELGVAVSASALLAAPTVAAMALVVVDALAAGSPDGLERFLAEPEPDGPGAPRLA